MSSFDTQEGGKHYLGFEIQPLKFILANDLSYPVGNVIKYVCRWEANKEILDLKKARDYLTKLIESEELQERSIVLERENEARSKSATGAGDSEGNDRLRAFVHRYGGTD